ncbi:helix-turn-helix transcriptional regulator [Plantactinospora sp. KBS50]|uniref:helix-turn-helix transcriptional regulator n=1 Tax=Plantactinospora sp. KBS50 TaxID=2024580 RepID=UPI000BAAD8C8|nr:helix-turn-helix transcriptional regulator [Plantactinospora sp. KBS50]ASW53614.1 hypothetical protein CIK06_04540 [Plantactinospora sp. KBS50]
MRTVLVCVRTPLAAQNVAAAAARLGLTAAVRTAVSDPEVMLRLAERPADVILADTALTRPDSAGFTRRVLARSPGAAVVLLGTEEPGAAAAAVAAGARGLVSAGDHDLVGAVARAMLLLSSPHRAIRPGELNGAAREGRGGVPEASRALRGGQHPDGRAVPGDGPLPGGGPLPGRGAGSAGSGAGGADPAHRRPAAPEAAPPGDPSGPAVVPVQRAEDGAEPRGADGEPAPNDPRANIAPEARYGGTRRGEANTSHSRGTPARRVTLTEREMQVLLGMADGKSNAEIGRELFVSEDTVKTHARRLFRKLGARDRAHAVAAGFRAGLVA